MGMRSCVLMYDVYFFWWIPRFEKEISSMKSWLDDCESVCDPAEELLCADQVKLTMELQRIQVWIFPLWVSPFAVSTELLRSRPPAGHPDWNPLQWRPTWGSVTYRVVSLPICTRSLRRRAERRAHPTSGEIRLIKEQHHTQAINFSFDLCIVGLTWGSVLGPRNIWFSILF